MSQKYFRFFSKFVIVAQLSAQTLEPQTPGTLSGIIYLQDTVLTLDHFGGNPFAFELTPKVFGTL